MSETTATAPTLALPFVALVATGGPVLLAGALAATGRPEVAAILPLGEAFEVSCALAALVLVVGWPLAALAAGVREGGLGARVVELVLLAAAGAPSLRLAALLSRAPEEASARALVGLGVLAGASALAVSGLARTRLRRSTVVVAGTALALGLPLAGSFVNDATGTDLGLARGSPVAAVLAQVHAEADPWALALAIAVLGIVLEVFAQVRLRRALRHLVLAGILFGGAATAAAQDPPALAVTETRLLLGPRARPGEAAPLRVRLQAGVQGFDGKIGVRSGGLLVLVPLSLQPRGTIALALPATGDRDGTPVLEARPTGGTPFVLGAREPQEEVASWGTLVGEVDDTSGEIARALTLPGRHLWRSTIARQDLDLVGEGGGALCALTLPAAVKVDAAVAAFVAEGGTLVLEDAAGLEAFADGGVRREREGLVLRGYGGGVVLARSAGAAPIASYFAAHHATRARTDARALALAVAESAEPTPSPRTGGRLAVLAGIVLLVLVLALVATRRQRPLRRAATFAVASLAVTAVVPWLVLRSARAPVVLEVSSVEEAPSGGSVAGRIEVLRLASPRRVLASVELAAGSALMPVFAAEADASRSRAELEMAAGTSTLTPGTARLVTPLSPGACGLFVRRGTRALGGAVTIKRGAAIEVENGLPVAIEQPLLVSKDGVVILDDLAPGGRSVVGGATVTFQELLRRMAAAPDAASRMRLHLLRAALLARPGAGTLKLAGFLPGGGARRATAGVLDEVEGPRLLIVTDEG